jgi:hypothetical protein
LWFNIFFKNIFYLKKEFFFYDFDVLLIYILF